MRQEFRVGFLPWQKLFLPGQWKKTGKMPGKCSTSGQGQGQGGLGRGVKPPNIEISPPPKHDGRTSATYELPQNIYSAIQILIVVCTVVFLCTHPRAVHTALVCSILMQDVSLQCFDAVGWAAGRASGL